MARTTAWRDDPHTSATPERFKSYRFAVPRSRLRILGKEIGCLGESEHFWGVLHFASETTRQNNFVKAASTIISTTVSPTLAPKGPLIKIGIAAINTAARTSTLLTSIFLRKNFLVK